MTRAEQRAAVVDFIRAQIMGPVTGSDEVLDEPPTTRYIVGILYPREVSTDVALEGEETEEVDGADTDDLFGDLADDPVALASQWMPSSVGISFYAEAPALDLHVDGAAYAEIAPGGTAKGWRRAPLGNGEPVRVVAPVNGSRVRETRHVLSDRARLDVFWRRSGEGHLVTVTLVNGRSHEGEGYPAAGDAIAQAGLRVEAVNGRIAEYPDVELLSLDEEERELALQYRRNRTYAIGHGAAADWMEQEPGSAAWVAVDFVPAYETPQLVPKSETRDVLDLERLERDGQDAAWLETGLASFVDEYREWIRALPSAHSDIPTWLTPSRDRIMSRLTEAADRMDAGVQLLTRDTPDAARCRKAFALANGVVLKAMRHGKDDLAGRPHTRGEVELPGSYLGLGYSWRPFQLAFQLLALPSMSDDAHSDRSLVDLLWFPTGGGKTEAYLGLAAYAIFLRRLRDPDATEGTVVLTRYTLRLLTAQQFQRAATVVCAAELARREDEQLLGSEPIDIGLWVGRDATPNDLAKARTDLADLREAERPTSPFQLDRCPWCGTRLAPERRSDDDADWGIEVGNDDFRFSCPHDACPFHGSIPANVVDEVLYRRPPTFLIATVDKFARLAWVPEAGVFLGGSGYPAPSLIIQDELHLLSGPLGTTVGLYEAAIESVITANGARPKVIASTATIRRADAQSLGLFGRHASVFPPPGLEADDSYFSRTDPDLPGRLYLGVMSQSTTPTFSLVHLAAAVAEAPIALRDSLDDEATDAYWTQVVYHNSLRELGKTVTLARDDVPARIRVISSDEALMREIGDDSVEELTSHVPGERLPAILGRMAVRRDEGDALDLVACTNMLSVGVDVPRLGLMIVNGQPKTTSEYIQATSRVGRSSERPGLVIALYSATKPRDRSHYESFRGYHGSLYRHVEPSSVTPFALPSRSRSLHAAIVILARHLLGAADNDAAASFDPHAPETATAIAKILTIVDKVDPRERPATEKHVDRLLAEWSERRDEDGPLRYSTRGRAQRSLLKDFGANGDGWNTLHSMRNVDRTCRVRVIGAE
jgi:hypothetical protein